MALNKIVSMHTNTLVEISNNTSDTELNDEKNYLFDPMTLY